MQVVDRTTELSLLLDQVRSRGQTVGLLPTMGALHDGHRELMRRAVADCDTVAVTIFVNPRQFGDRADLAHYPRSLQQDLQMCEQEGVSVVFAPPVEEMYPETAGQRSTVVHAGSAAEGLEGAARPGHFDGVATVVAKLFAMAGRCRAYFGEKDFQQLVVVRQLASDLNFPVEVVACPTVRERDGLARSSRNARLSSKQRSAATVLHRALVAGQQAIVDGERDPRSVQEQMATVVGGEPLAALDYAAVVDPDTLQTPATLTPSRPWRLLVAACVGPVHLIDNLEATPPAGLSASPLSSSLPAASPPAPSPPAAPRPSGPSSQGAS